MNSSIITGCLSSSPIPLLSEASPPNLQVIVTHFVLPSHEWALYFPTSFLILGLARPGMKSGLSRTSSRAFAYSFPHALSYFSKGGFLCLPSLSSMKPAFLHCGAHSFLPMLPLRCPSLPRQGAVLAHLDSHLTNW